MKPEDWDQGGRKGLRRGLSGKKKGEEVRGNPQEPELRASSHCSEQLRREGAWQGGWMRSGNSTWPCYEAYKWVGCDINSWQTSGHRHKNLCITLNHTPSQGLNEEQCGCKSYVFKLLTTERPPTLLIHYVYQLMSVCIPVCVVWLTTPKAIKWSFLDMQRTNVRSKRTRTSEDDIERERATGGWELSKSEKRRMDQTDRLKCNGNREIGITGDYRVIGFIRIVVH